MDFETIFRDSPVPAMVLDRGLRFVAANDAYCQMVDRSRAQMLGRYVFDVFPEDPERVTAMIEVFNRALAGERPTFREIPFTILVDGKQEEHWWTAHHGPVAGASGTIDYIVQFSENVTNQVRLREMESALVNELQHRVGNIFAVVRALARQVARNATDVAEFARMFDDRLTAFFSGQQDLMGRRGQGVPIAEVFDRQLRIFGATTLAEITANGPEVMLNPDHAQALSMAIYELGTNSVKYGALGNPEGRLAIEWNTDASGTLTLVWLERGIRAEAGEAKGGSGYGTALLTTVVPRQLNGRAERILEPDRFEYRLTMAHRE